MTVPASGAEEPVVVSSDSSEKLDQLESKLVWIFGSPRTGSTWIMRLLQARRGILTIDESDLPAHLVPSGKVTADGEFFRANVRSEDPNYFFASRYLDQLWPELRRLALRQLNRQIRELRGTMPVHSVVVKEPNGSHAADSILRLFPKARMIFVLRDGRDVIDSLLDAMQGGEETWWQARRGGTAAGASAASQPRRDFIQRHAKQWVFRIQASRRAFEALESDQRLLLRYEDMLADTARQLSDVYAWLDLPVDPKRVAEIVADHEFSRIDPSRRGPGTKFRAATPGLWREHFDDDETALMNEIMGETLVALGYDL